MIIKYKYLKRDVYIVYDFKYECNKMKKYISNISKKQFKFIYYNNDIIYINKDKNYLKLEEMNILKEQIIRKIFNGLIYIHILHHADKESFYGSWMIEELKEHGYNMSPGTLYPILKTMVDEDLLEKEEKNVNGKIRKYYKSTKEGNELLLELKKSLKVLVDEVM